MRTIILLGVILGFSACQPQQVNQAAQQQHFIYKSLIEGFLKAQHWSEYPNDHLQPTYTATASVRTMVIAIASRGHNNENQHTHSTKFAV